MGSWYGNNQFPVNPIYKYIYFKAEGAPAGAMTITMKIKMTYYI